mmetsp:Transcript_53932/g.101199  ORF Transcript_53932/g.101199 Transcript_53932/m.101199 type:complete len:536 (-) Transcript_53932:30-1637(-)
MTLKKHFALLVALLAHVLASELTPEHRCTLDRESPRCLALDLPDAIDSDDALSHLQIRKEAKERTRATDPEATTLLQVQASGNFYKYSLLVLLVCTGVAAWFTRPQLESPDDMTPTFRSFRFVFLAAWALAVSADWLQGPYVYALYDSFGYAKTDIDKLFVAGFGSSMIFGPFAGSFADAWGRKRTVLIYCILYIMSCLTKHCSTYNVLMLGRITGGMATSLLFSAFESWMVSESNERYLFNKALLRYMFSLMYFVSYLVAILSGVVAQAFVDAVPLTKIQGFDSLYYGGDLCPFDLSILVLCCAFAMVCFTWDENYGSGDKQAFVEAFSASCKALFSSWKICILGLLVACFEGSMYSFVINWTPTLSISGAPDPPHGLVFSAMMMCCMTGSSTFSFLNPDIDPAKALLFSFAMSALAFAAIAFKCEQVENVSVVYFSFLFFEFCVGLYFPSIGALKSELVPEEARAGVYNWFRVPLNIVVCGVILTDMELQTAFITCALLMLAGLGMTLPVVQLRELETNKTGRSEPLTAEIRT